MFLRPLAFFLAVSTSWAGSDLEANQLLQYFSSGCATQGQWTQTALGYANGLVETLKTLAQDSDCQSINGAFTQAQSITSALNTLSQDTNAKTIAGLKRQEQELLLFMSQATDPDDVAAFVRQLQTLQVSIAQTESYASSDTDYQNQLRKGRVVNTLVTGTQILLQQAVQNQACIQKHGAFSIFSGLAGLAGSVGAVALTGGQSLLAAAGVDTMNLVIEAARKYRLARKLSKITSVLAASAYQCAFETLSNQWCAAEDALRMVKIYGNSLTQTQKPTPLQNGINILNQDAGLFLRWLDSIRAGSDPGTQAIATLQVQTIERDKQVRAARINGLGIIAQNKPIFDRISNADLVAQWNIEYQAIQSIVTSFSSTGGTAGTSVLMDVFGGDATIIAEWFLIGVSVEKIPRDPNGAKRRIRDFSLSEIIPITGDASFKPNLFSLRGKMLDWIALGKKRVDAEMALILNLDPQKLIVDAATPDLNGRASILSLKKIILFLETQQVPSSLTGSFKNLYDDTIKRLQNIRCDIEQVLNVQPVKDCDRPSGTDPVAALADISKQAVLENGTGFLGDRILWALRLSLNQMVLGGTGGVTPGDAAALLAQNDIVLELQSYSNTSDLNLMARDIENSQVIVEKTLSQFAALFSKGIKKSAQSLEKDASYKSQQAVAELCLKLLAVPQWPKSVPEELCYGKSLKSIFKDGPQSEVITSKLIHSTFSERACKFREYNRKNWLFQNFAGKKPFSS